MPAPMTATDTGASTWRRLASSAVRSRPSMVAIARASGRRSISTSAVPPSYRIVVSTHVPERAQRQTVLREDVGDESGDAVASGQGSEVLEQQRPDALP